VVWGSKPMPGQKLGRVAVVNRSTARRVLLHMPPYHEYNESQGDFDAYCDHL